MRRRATTTEPKFMAYGVTSTGFTRPSVLELKALFEIDQRAEISASLDLSTDSVLGQLNGIYARHLGIVWEAVEAAYHAFDPDRAEGEQLTALAKITATERAAASKSQLEGVRAVRVTLTSGTTLLAGVHFAHVTDKPDVRFTPQANFTAPSNGDHFVDFESELTGPVHAPAGTLTIIATPVVGWSAVTNPQDEVPGSDIDTDATLRRRRAEALAKTGSSTVDAIRADVLGVTDVSSVQIFENYTDDTDANGLPPHSFEVVLYDDAGAANNAIAQAIWGTKPAGIQPYGIAHSGSATDANADVHVIPFSRAAAKNIWIEFDVTPRDGYVGDSAFEQAVVLALNALLGTGDDVNFYDVLIATEGLGARVTGVRFGIAAIPTVDTDVIVGNREIARFDTSRVIVNS